MADTDTDGLPPWRDLELLGAAADTVDSLIATYREAFEAGQPVTTADIVVQLLGHCSDQDLDDLETVRGLMQGLAAICAQAIQRLVIG
jgi:hypothetical protein